MATNWNMKMYGEAMVGKPEVKTAAVADAGRRFPLATNLMSEIMGELSSEGKESFAKLLGALPEWVTVRKIETVLKGDVEDTDNEGEEEVEEKKPEKKAKKEEKKPAKKATKKVEPEEEEDDEEEDDDEEEVKPKKKAKKEEKKPAKKAKKKVEEDDDEDDDDDDDDWN